MSGRYPSLNNTYNPIYQRSGKELDKREQASWNKAYSTLKSGPLPTSKMTGATPSFMYLKKPVRAVNQGDNVRETIDRDNINAGHERVRQDLDTRYPFTYPIPQEKKWNLRDRFVSEEGQALFPAPNMSASQTATGRDLPSVGKVFVPESYWDYQWQLYEREEVEAFKDFCFAQMDISTPVKKEYWKKRCPALFKELVQGLVLKRQKEYNLDMLDLFDPQTIDDFQYLYDNMVKPDLYAKDMENKGILGAQNPPAPTTLPFPQNKATDLFKLRV